MKTDLPIFKKPNPFTGETVGRILRLFRKCLTQDSEKLINVRSILLIPMFFINSIVSDVDQGLRPKTNQRYLKIMNY